MKFSVAVLLTVLLAYTAFLYSNIVPWWGFAIGAFLVGITVPLPAWASWLSGFAGLLLCWGGLAWYIDNQNESLFSAKMAIVFPLGGSSLVLIAVTAFLGAFIGGFAALAGAFTRKKMVKPD